MKYIDILNKIQTELLSLQSSLNELRCMDGSSTCDVYITRQEAAGRAYAEARFGFEGFARQVRVGLGENPAGR